MDEVVVGTYEGFLSGYSILSVESEKKIKQTFATHSHTASVRCISIAGKFLASGGTDDKVVILDMKTRKEHTVLMNHDGTVNAVAFTNNGTHLLSGSDDGSIIVTRTGNWQIEKIWKKAHGGQPVVDITIHPSDKLALTIGGDKTLRTWNLVKGRPAFTVNLASKGVLLPTEIKFSPDGTRFSLVSQQAVDIWTLEKAGLEKRISFKSRPATVQWIDDKRILVGLDNGNIVSLTISNADKAVTYQGHKQRVKCIYYENSMMYSASSSGEIKVWFVSNSKLSEICSVNAACRVTCMALNRQNHLIKKEEASDNEQENTEANEEQLSENSNDDEEIRPPEQKRKRMPGAYVTISYDDNENNKELNPQPPKKVKKRKRNKKLKKTNT